MLPEASRRQSVFVYFWKANRSSGTASFGLASLPVFAETVVFASGPRVVLARKIQKGILRWADGLNSLGVVGVLAWRGSPRP